MRGEGPTALDGRVKYPALVEAKRIMKQARNKLYLEELAGSLGRGTTARTHRWSRNVVRAYIALCAAVLAIGFGATGAYRAVGQFHRGDTIRRELAASLLLHGPALSESERVKLSFLDSMLEHHLRDLSGVERRRLAETLYVAGRRHGIDPLLALAVIRQESNYQPTARSIVGALGLMQVRPFVGQAVAAQHGVEWTGPETLFDPSRNVEIGIAYLAHVKRMYQTNPLALSAYNVGPHALRKHLATSTGLPNDYSAKVLRFYTRYQRAYLAALAEVGLGIGSEVGQLAALTRTSAEASGI